MDKNRSFLCNIKKYKSRYIMIMSGITCLVLFNYIPMVELQIAFKNFKP